MTFNIGGANFAEGTISKVRGNRNGLGFYMLELDLQLILQPRTTYSNKLQDSDNLIVTEMECRVSIGVGAEGSRYLGRGSTRNRFLRTHSYSEVATTEEIQFIVELGKDHLVAIEDWRIDKSVKFECVFEGQAFMGTKPVNFGESLHRDIKATDWVDVLNEMGFKRTRFVEVPEFDQKNCPELAKAGESIGEALNHIREGRWRHAVGECREVMESIDLAYKDRDNVSIKRLIENKMKLDKSQRLLILREAIRIVAHPAKHADEVSQNIIWEKEDALTMVSMTTALLRLLAVSSDGAPAKTLDERSLE